MATPKHGAASRTGVAHKRGTTLLDLVKAVEAFAENEAETAATLRHLVATGRVKLVAGSSLPLSLSA